MSGRDLSYRAVLSVVVLAVAVLASCSAGVHGQPTGIGIEDQRQTVTEDLAPPEPTPQATDIDPCALVTKEEAEAIVGLELRDEERGNPDRPSCTYFGLPTGPVAKVDIYVGEGAENIMNLDRDVLGHDFTEIDIGDEAYAKDHQVFFRKGDVWVFISVRCASSTPTRHGGRSRQRHGSP